ncbi:MAG: hypothetical protein ACK5P4_09270, partial [Bacteroidota bacterium]
MSHFFRFAIILSVALITAFSASAKNLKAYLMMAEFTGNQEGNFIETYLNIASKSINYAKNS